MGVVPGKTAVEMAMQAAQDGTEYERLMALDYVRLHGKEDAIVLLYHTLYGAEAELRETAFDAIWHLAATGVNLPSPIQFGLG